MRTIASCHVKDIATVSSAKDNTKMVTIAFKSQSRLSWSSSSWLLKCQNMENAERLISDIREVLSSYFEILWIGMYSLRVPSISKLKLL